MLEKSHLNKEKLMEQIQYVYETDIGDFKRKAVLYLNRFFETQEDQDLKKKIQELKDFVICQEFSSKDQMENIDKLRFHILEELKKL